MSLIVFMQVWWALVTVPTSTCLNQSFSSNHYHNSHFYTLYPCYEETLSEILKKVLPIHYKQEVLFITKFFTDFTY